MAIASETLRAKQVGTMSLSEIRQHLLRFSRPGEGKLDPRERERLQKKLREILGRLAKVSRRGGRFAQVRPSRQFLELFERSRWG